ncbi:MAG: hypothetical protein AMJ55_12945 [Gammaproteobacteria bacterium SG8_15]|nr:MAG: hypothetical protein AMJ55_12945 [Gammaproteobacteria bacterium SG8_15]
MNIMKHKYRSVFISDVHLGTKDVRNDCLLNFLNTIEAEYIYLVGDIVDGNHDERLRDYIGSNLNDVIIREDTIHVTRDNKKLLVIHGDEFDSVVMTNKWLVYFGALSNFLKMRAKKAVQYIENFENAVIHEAKRRGVDGVVCGHIHHPAMKQVDGITYANTGDWVENCTAVVENKNGHLEVLHWANIHELDVQPIPAVAAATSKAA